MLNSYFQSFGAVSLIKVNSAWFHISERGIFSAIFGSMIQMGRAMIFMLGPIIVTFLPWQWLFFLPSVIIAVFAFFSYLAVKDSPEKCGFRRLEVGDASTGEADRVSVKYVLKKIFTNPVTLSIAFAEFCTGFVRQGFEQWFPRYMIEVQNLPMESAVFQKNAIAIVIAGVLGAFLAGTLSDWVFKGRRTPVAFLGYLAQVVCLFIIWMAPSLHWIMGAFIVNSCAISMVQSMLSGTRIHGLWWPKRCGYCSRSL
jgi:OPA family glycerol-3-phosphate transporter-like MFS transporter